METTTVIIYQISTIFLFFIILFIQWRLWNKVNNNRIRINYFHWIYNYRFRNLGLKIMDGEPSNDKEEYDYIKNKISTHYSTLTYREALKLLEPHYIFVKDEIKEYEKNIMGNKV